MLGVQSVLVVVHVPGCGMPCAVAVFRYDCRFFCVAVWYKFRSTSQSQRELRSPYLYLILCA
jgi:hypothetical protein